MADRAFTSIEDFVFDVSFREWVLYNNNTHQGFWESWMVANPDKLGLMNYARSIVYALSAGHSRLSEQEIDQEIRNILHKATTASLHEAEPSDVPTTDVSTGRRFSFRWLGGTVAAAALILAAVLYFGHETSSRPQPVAYHSPGKKDQSYLSRTEKINTADTAITVLLPDQSRVELSARSSISYTAESFKEKREIHLTGEAFFSVIKNPAAPFLVYTSNMVTKVLGTSFRVKEFPGDKKGSVLVKTGKVSVYKQQAFSAGDAVSKQLGGVIVIPNQQVTYDLITNELTKNIIEKPVLLEKTGETIFSFHSTPLKEVFAVLEHAYGIQVMYDESLISSCSLSVNMGNETFYEKLDLICKAVNASYESIDGSIFVTSHGCK